MQNKYCIVAFVWAWFFTSIVCNHVKEAHLPLIIGIKYVFCNDTIYVYEIMTQFMHMKLWWILSIIFKKTLKNKYTKVYTLWIHKGITESKVPPPPIFNVIQRRMCSIYKDTCVYYFSPIISFFFFYTFIVLVDQWIKAIWLSKDTSKTMLAALLTLSSGEKCCLLWRFFKFKD